ncbi:MAG: MarR family transcriptional regulator, partial [Pseudomonadota bacterium]
MLLERLSRLIQNGATTDGLRPTHWEALRYLARANRFSRTPTALTAYLGVTKGTVSQSIAALEKKGLVKKDAAGGDRRRVRLALTRAGRARLTDDPLAAIDQAVDDLPADLRKAVTRGLSQALTSLLHERE